LSTTISEKAISSLFPKGEIAWEGMSGGTQKEISDGLAVQMERDRINGENIVKDFFPETTTFLEEWEFTFRLPTGELLTDEQRIARLNAAWTKKSPAAYTLMNEIYALSGFDVIARPLDPAEDPRVIANTDVDIRTNLCKCGAARCGQLSESSRCGSFEVDKGTESPIIFGDGRPGEIVSNYITKCGVSRCGLLQTSSLCGNFQGSRFLPANFIIPDEVWTWPLIYILERSDGEFAQVPIELQDAYDFLTLKIKPNLMWAISRVEYVDGGML